MCACVSLGFPSISRETQTNRKHAAGSDIFTATRCRSRVGGHQSSTTNHPPISNHSPGQVKWGAIPYGNTCPYSGTRPNFYWSYLIVLTVLIFLVFFRLVFLFVAGIFITVVLPCNFDSRRRHKMTEYQNRGATNSVCRPGNVSTRLVKISFGWAFWGGGACFCHRCLCLSFVLS